MKAHITSIYYLLLLCRYVIYASEIISSNETLPEDRHPRVNGRIVKLYSGNHPEPIYCPQEGFRADPINCAVFYRCVKGANNKFTVFRFQCGPGTIYDPDTEVCNFPRNTKRTECAGFSSPLGDKGNENEIEGFNSELPSPINSRPAYSEATVQSTAYPWQTTTKDNSHSASTAAWVTTASYQELLSQPSRQEGDTCTKDGFMGDSRNCRKFYRCVGNQRGGFIRYEFSCSETTVWDDEVQSCNHPWATQRSRCSRSDSSSTSTLPSQLNYGNKVTQSQIAHGPVIQNHTQINNGNYDKSKENSQVKQNQTQISQSQMQINYGNEVHTELQEDHNKDSSQAQAQVYETTSKPSTPSITAFENEQDQGYGNQLSSQENANTENYTNKCNESGFIGDKTDCKKFYRCVENGRGGYIKYEFSCGEGTVWDSSIEACNHAWAVKECGGKAPQNSPQSGSQTTTTTKPNTQTTTEMTTNDNNEDPGYGGLTTQSIATSQTKTTTSKPVTTTSVSSSSSEATCTSSGFMGEPQDCKKFYRCVDNGNGGYTRYEFSCGEGTVWDTEIEACNHAWAVKKCGGESSGGAGDKETTSSERPTMSDEEVSDSQPSYPVQSSETTTHSTDQPAKTTTTKPIPGKECSQEGFMGDGNDCKKFYRCVDNGRGGFTRYEFSCGEGTIWDSEINACNHPNSVKSSCSTTTTQDQSIPEPSQDSNTENGSQVTGIQLSTQQSQTTETSSQKPQYPNDKCNAEGFYGDSNDCKKFFRCVDNGKGGYTKYDFTCGDGTIWDQEIQACNHQPSDSNCSQQTGQTGSTEENNGVISSTTQKEQFTPGTQAPATASNGTCTSEGFYANPEDCSKFYRCVDDGKGGYIKYEFSCGDGTIWVQEIQACDHDTDETCTSQNAPISSENNYEQSSPTSTDSTYTQQTDTQNDENPNVSSSPIAGSGSEKCTSEGFYANQNDCKKFYRCVDNGHGGYAKYDYTCGEGTAWDSDIQSCNHIKEVKSCQGQEQDHGTPIQDEEVTQSPGGTTQSSTSGPAIEGSKPSSNDNCNQEGYYGNSQDCTKFYRCVDNGKGGFTKYDFSCGEGTIWDQDITTCNHPQDVSNPSCKQQIENGDSSSSSSESSSSSTSSTTESSSEASDCSQQPTKKPNNNVNCTEAGYYPDPSDCKKFYRCVDWDGDGKRFSVYHFECGEGTIWDPALDTCNHEDSVYPPRDCSGTQPQGETVDKEPSTTETVTTTESETTQESTTAQSTTQQSTSSDHTTTEQTTTSDHTTTQQMTTSEQTTTQKTTTQESTTSVHTTTQYPPQTTTTEQSNEETTTTQQNTTTQESSTQESTTHQSETTEHTTDSSTDSTTTTTQSTTTEGSTTESSTTEGTTTESSTTESSTTEGTTSQTDETETTESTTTSQSNDTSTTESGQDSTTGSSGDVTTESTSEKDCPSTDDDQNLFVCPTSFKRHPKYCNMFYQCTEDDDTHDVQIATFRCPNNTIYDENKTQCVEEKKADKKCDGEIAQKRRVKRLDTFYKEPIVVTNERLKCPSAGHYPFEKGECSPAFLKCQKTKSGKLRGYVYQCPQGYVYWSVSRRCESKSNVRDCKNSHNDWNGRWEIPIERRNVAP